MNHQEQFDALIREAFHTMALVERMRYVGDTSNDARMQFAQLEQHFNDIHRRMSQLLKDDQ